MMLCAKRSIPLAEASKRLERLIFFISRDWNREKVLLMTADIRRTEKKHCQSLQIYEEQRKIHILFHIIYNFLLTATCMFPIY
jgi:hypothetical protein